MPETITPDLDANLPAGTQAPAVGVYVVSHFDPTHSAAHEVWIGIRMILPKCHTCANVRYSLKSLPAEPIEGNEFFRK